MEGSAGCRGVSIPAEHHSRCPTWNEWAQFIFQKRYKPSAIRSRDLRQLLFLSLPRRARLTRVINNISTSHRTSRGRSGPNLNRTKASWCTRIIFVSVIPWKIIYLEIFMWFLPQVSPSSICFFKWVFARMLFAFAAAAWCEIEILFPFPERRLSEVCACKTLHSSPPSPPPLPTIES